MTEVKVTNIHIEYRVCLERPLKEYKSIFYNLRTLFFVAIYRTIHLFENGR